MTAPRRTAAEQVKRDLLVTMLLRIRDANRTGDEPDLSPAQRRANLARLRQLSREPGFGIAIRELLSEANSPAPYLNTIPNPDAEQEPR